MLWGILRKEKGGKILLEFFKKNKHKDNQKGIRLIFLSLGNEIWIGWKSSQGLEAQFRRDGNIKGNFESANYYVGKRYLFFLIYQSGRETSLTVANVGGRLEGVMGESNSSLCWKDTGKQRDFRKRPWK